MRRQTLTIATTTRRRVSFTTNAASLRLHCFVCGRQVETISLDEASMLSDLAGGELALHRIPQTGGVTRVCRNSAALDDLGGRS